jgi:hypothetical protein
MPALAPDDGALRPASIRSLRRARATLRLHARALLATGLVLGILLMVLHWR